LSFERFFEELARWYGVDVVNGSVDDESKYDDVEFAAGKDAPIGQFTLTTQ
jgi:hypothetical protein